MTAELSVYSTNAEVAAGLRRLSRNLRGTGASHSVLSVWRHVQERCVSLAVLILNSLCQRRPLPRTLRGMRSAQRKVGFGRETRHPFLRRAHWFRDRMLLCWHRFSQELPTLPGLSCQLTWSMQHRPNLCKQDRFCSHLSHIPCQF
jgi:hypothetical protein